MSDVFVDIKNQSFDSEEPNENFARVATMQIGSGSNVFRGDESGIWLGAAKFADAPFKVTMAGAVTMTSATITGYVEDVGGTYDSAASGARVRIFPDANTGIQIIDDSSNNVFLAYVGGASVGDVLIGNYSGGSGILWDKSASTLYIKGDITAGNISGVTITGSTFKTASSGVRVQINEDEARITFHDAGGDIAGEIDEDGSNFIFEGKDGRDVKIIAAGGDIICEDKVKITTSAGMEFTGERSSALSYDWGFAPYVSGGAYGWVSEMEGGTWNFAMNAGVPT